ncbi:MAG: glycosyltransferase family 87 protein [Candidatus Sulfotelmatobacter sp.]
MNRRWLRFVLLIIALLMAGDFIFRGLLIAPGTIRNDFSEPYVGSWLLRHGENFYDSTLTTATATQLTGSRVDLVLIYQPTTLLLVMPFTFLPWAWANTIWLTLGLAAIGITISLLIRLSGLRFADDRAWVFATFILTFAPLHQAFHIGNVALMAVPLCFLGIYLAEERWDFAAGVILAIATALKPQLGLWVLLFYLIQLRKRFVVGALLPAAALAGAMIHYPVPLGALISGYRANLHYWFAPGHLIGFTEGSLPFHVSTMQVVLYQIVHRVTLTSVIAQLLFMLGLTLWVFAMVRNRFQVSVPLAISSLLALSFISLYHSVPDTTILTLALCWAYGRNADLEKNLTKRVVCIIFLLLMLPGHSVLIRSAGHLSPWLTESWWWKLLVARYFAWLLLALNCVLLYALMASYPKAQPSSMELESQAMAPAVQ